MIHYNYITTNKINGKQYVGAHSTNNINDGYLGGGLLINKAIKKYGKENFTRKILYYAWNFEMAFSNEKLLIKKYNTLVPNGYNISPTGGLNVPNCHSKETKEKMRQAKLGKKSAMCGKHHSEKSIKKISEVLSGENNPNYGKKAINKNGKNKYVEEEYIPYWENKGWKRGGKPKSEETKKKIGKANTGKKLGPRSKETKEKISKTLIGMKYQKKKGN